MAMDLRQGLGTSITVKIGSRYPSLNDWRHYVSWRHGQVVEIREMGYIPPMDMTRKHNLVIDLPNVQYWNMRGDTDWKSTRNSVLHLKKYVSVSNEHGSYRWNSGLGGNFKAKGLHNKEKRREWLVDPEWLLQQRYITQGQWESIYDKSRPHEPIVLTNIFNIEDLLKHEDSWTRLSREKDSARGSVAAGDYAVGTGAQGAYDGIYATWTLAEVDIAAQMTAALGFYGQDEETAITIDVVWDTDTNGFLLKLTADPGAEHDGSAYGNGARIVMTVSDSFTLNETTNGDLDDVEISKLAFDCTGLGNSGVIVIDGADNGLFTINRCLFEGSSISTLGIDLAGNNAKNVLFTNNIIYNFGEASNDGGIVIRNASFGTTYSIYNNTCIGCYENFIQDNPTTTTTLNFKNNLAQASQNVDYRDDGGGFGTTAKNISEDATSPDAAYRSKDLHTNSVFVNYATDNFKIDKDGDATNLAIVDDGEDLSGTFTDDINHDAGRRP